MTFPPNILRHIVPRGDRLHPPAGARRNVHVRVKDNLVTGFSAELPHSAGAAIKGVVSNALEKARGTGSTVPEPAECGCPCFNYPENGWRRCPFLEHKLEETAKRGIVLGADFVGQRRIGYCSARRHWCSRRFFRL